MNTLPPPEKSVSEIVDLASAFYGSAVLFAALDVGVFKALAALGGSADLTALAAETEAAPRALRRRESSASLGASPQSAAGAG